MKFQRNVNKKIVKVNIQSKIKSPKFTGSTILRRGGPHRQQPHPLRPNIPHNNNGTFQPRDQPHGIHNEEEVALHHVVPLGHERAPRLRDGLHLRNVLPNILRLHHRLNRHLDLRHDDPHEVPAADPQK